MHLPPAQWDNGDALREKWYAGSYLHANVGPQIGTALAMRLLGLTSAMSPAMDGFVAQWMAPTPSEVVQQLAAQGISLPWGTDFSADRAADFCAAAWRKHS